MYGNYSNLLLEASAPADAARASCIKNALEDELNLAEVPLSVQRVVLLLCSLLCRDGVGK